MSRPKKTDQLGVIARAKKFLRGAWVELKKVHWPGRSELITYTSVVLVSVVIVSAMIWVADSILSFLLKLVLTK